MSDSGDGYFVGAMPTQLFLDEFMKTTNRIPATPIADFSGIQLEGTIHDMCGSFVSLRL